jgi:hypothetical protein
MKPTGRYTIVRFHTNSLKAHLADRKKGVTLCGTPWQFPYKENKKGHDDVYDAADQFTNLNQASCMKCWNKSIKIFKERG